LNPNVDWQMKLFWLVKLRLSQLLRPEWPISPIPTVLEKSQTPVSCSVVFTALIEDVLYRFSVRLKFTIDSNITAAHDFHCANPPGRGL